MENISLRKALDIYDCPPMLPGSKWLRVDCGNVLFFDRGGGEFIVVRGHSTQNIIIAAVLEVEWHREADRLKSADKITMEGNDGIVEALINAQLWREWGGWG